MSLYEKFKEAVIAHLGISSTQLSAAEALAHSEGILIVHALIRNKVADENHLLNIYAKIYQVKIAQIDAMDIPSNIIKIIENEIARKNKIIPLERVGNNLIIAATNPNDLKLTDLIRFKTGYFIKAVISSEAQMERALEKYYPLQHKNIEKISHNKVTKPKAKQEKRAVIGKATSEESGAIVEIVDEILTQCLTRRASDIHIEPYESYLRVRLRIDGALHEIARPSSDLSAPIISRVKIMAGLNIAEKRLPQDGNINVEIQNKPIDFRVNTLPTLYGEKIVLRILDKSSLNVDLTQLGFERTDFENFKDSIHQPHGMVLVTGPTGSGKTTTLYSALSELNKVSDNIITAEDPVEYTLDGINQVHINTKIGLTFASALRAFLRQDPDIIMVGEIRDLETAEIAIKAALTGHLVLSTLHTNSAADTITRLLNMGLEAFNIISALNAIVAQRLCRRLCVDCKEIDSEITPKFLRSIGVPNSLADNAQAYKAVGCNKCAKTGYKGRIAIHEVMTMSDDLRKAIMENASGQHLKLIAMQGGMKTLRQNALIKLLQGITDVPEVLSTTASDGSDAKELNETVVA